MTELGYALLTEEHGPDDLTEHAVRAEEVGFDFAMISDHYHPWTTKQGESPFVWNVIGAIARETEEIRLGTGVSAPIHRIHPALIAQAAATAGVQMPGRFIFGVGTGENLNEHIYGDRWPPHDVRLDMLEEAVEIVRLLWEGGQKTYRGEHFTVENATVFTLPEEPPPIAIAAGGDRAAAAAGHYGDAVITTSPDPDVADRYEEAGGDGAKYGMTHVCYAETEDEGVETAYEHWPNGAIGGELGQLLPTPAHFEQAAGMVEHDDIRERIVCGPDPEEHVAEIQDYIDAGYDHVYVHQIGPNQEEFMEFYEEQVLPEFS